MVAQLGHKMVDCMNCCSIFEFFGNFAASVLKQVYTIQCILFSSTEIKILSQKSTFLINFVTSKHIQ